MNDALITKYRPKTFAEVIGQASVVRALQTALTKGTSKAFMFSGDSGLGKTTLARLAALAAGCSPSDIVDYDGVAQSTKEELQSVTGTLMYRPLGEGKTKAIIVDEAQGLSKAALNSLLKILEEPPPWVFWFICTTEPARIPAALNTRVTHFSLKSVGFEDLAALLDKIVATENLSISEQVVDLCASEAGGSPRQALSNLSACISAKDTSEAKLLLRSALDSQEAISLARALVKRESWAATQKILVGLKDTSPESIRHIVRAYVTKVALGAKNEASAGAALEILAEFSEPFHSSDGLSPVVLACGRIVLR